MTYRSFGVCNRYLFSLKFFLAAIDNAVNVHVGAFVDADAVGAELFVHFVEVVLHFAAVGEFAVAFFGA